jgi:hypothetical protein
MRVPKATRVWCSAPGYDAGGREPDSPSRSWLSRQGSSRRSRWARHRVNYGVRARILRRRTGHSHRQAPEDAWQESAVDKHLVVQDSSDSTRIEG